MVKVLDVGLTWGGPITPCLEPWEMDVVEYDHRRDLDEQLKDVGLVIFSGGTDVNPELYGHRNVASGYPDILRDLHEKKIFEGAYKRNIPRLGICRGSQFLCVMHGGWLVQDMDGHGGQNHKVALTHDPAGRRTIITNSYHHQMVVPNRHHSTILGSTQNMGHRFKYDTDAIQQPPSFDFNPEIVYYADHEGGPSLGVQYHPEYYGDAQHEICVMLRQYIFRYLHVGDK